MINDILDFSKIEAGKLDVETIPVDLRDLVEFCMGPFAVRAHQKKLELAAEISQECPAAFLGDPTRLRQVLLNLLGNALKFTLQGEVVLRGAPVRQEHGAALQFSVSDTGIGIPPDKRKTIFEAFAQADGSTTRKFGGTGLGLAISHRLVDLMQGKVWLESEPGLGTTFYVTIPLVAAHDSQPALDLRDLVQTRVLIVDDNETNRRIMERMLAGWKFQVSSAADGESALRALQQARIKNEPYQLVLVDYHMPEMDGLELAGRIRSSAEFSNPVIMMLTSDDCNVTIGRCKEIGIEKYLTKPVRQMALIDAMRKLLSDAPGNPRGHCAASKGEPAPANDAQPLRILLAEDHPVNQKVAVKLLERLGHTVTVADNGWEALALLRRHGFDLVLMDVQMPVMDGFEATAAIRAEEVRSGSRIPIIALTAHAMKGDAERCLAAGMDVHLAKPIRPAELVKAMESLATKNLAPLAGIEIPADLGK